MKLRSALSRIRREGQRLLLLLVGTAVSALGYSLFQVPYNIAAGGVSGISLIINSFTGWPMGVMIMIMNVPLVIFGYFQLGRWRFLFRTVIAVVTFSSWVDLFNGYLPRLLDRFPLTSDILLSAIYAGIVGGIGMGLIYRSGGTLGGTSILGRIIQLRTGAPLSQVYFYTDGLIVVTAGIVFGWEVALYALLTMFINGLASDYTLEGPSSVRTATIITDHPQLVAERLITELDRGVSRWTITGGYTGESHTMLLCTIYRPQVADLKRIVAQTDERAFVVIGTAHEALGYGFRPLRQGRIG